MIETRALPVIELRGDPLTRGQQHGEELRALIHQNADGYRGWIAQTSGGIDPARLIEKLVHEQGYLAVCEALCPDLVAECRGVAEGAGLDFPTVFAMQLLDESWWLALEAGQGAQPHHCTSIGMACENGSLIAQNMDVPVYLDGLQVVLHESSGADETIVLSVAGMLGLCGLNRRGVGICCNSLTQLDHQDAGIPVAFVVRTVLQQASAFEAAAHVRSLSHATAQNYIIGGPDGVVDLEVSARSVHELEGRASDGVVWHTNHPLVNRDRDMYEARSSADQRARDEGPDSDTVRRFAFASDWVSQERTLDAAAIKGLLGSPEVPICVPRRAEGGHTLATVLMECSAEPRFHVTRPPASAGDYMTLTFGNSA